MRDDGFGISRCSLVIGTPTIDLTPPLDVKQAESNNQCRVDFLFFIFLQK